MLVLILVLMEDALAHYMHKPLAAQDSEVLILVLMEDALAPGRRRFSPSLL